MWCFLPHSNGARKQYGGGDGVCMCLSVCVCYENSVFRTQISLSHTHAQKQRVCVSGGVSMHLYSLD